MLEEKLKNKAKRVKWIWWVFSFVSGKREKDSEMETQETSFIPVLLREFHKLFSLFRAHFLIYKINCEEV